MNKALCKKFGPVVAQIMLNAGRKITDPARRALVLEVATQALSAKKAKNAKASMKKAKNDMVKREENLLVLRSMKPAIVIPRLERGANATLLTAENTTRAFIDFEKLARQLLPAPHIETMEGIARMLTMLLRHGAPFSSADFDIKYYIDASVRAHVYHGKGRIAFLNLIKALVERGVVDAHRMITAHTIFGNAYKSDRTPETWNRVLEIINKLIPTPQNGARRAAVQHILQESLEYLKRIRPYEVEGLLRLGGHLTPQLLDAYIMGAKVTLDSNDQITNVKLDDAILNMFWRAGVRVPRRYGGSTYRYTSFWNIVRQKLVRHDLYNVAQPKPKPTRRTARQPVKRKRPNMNGSPTAKRRNVNRGA